MASDKTDFRKLNLEVQEKLDFALQKFQEMKMERDHALRMLQRQQGRRSRSLEAILEGVNGKETDVPYFDDNDEQEGCIDGDEDDDDDENEFVWEIFNVVLNQENGQGGFGINFKGGRDDPYFLDDNPSIVVTYVAKSGPADGKLMVGDQLQSINDISLDNIDRSTLLSIFQESGNSINLVVRRRILLPSKRLDHPLRVTLVKKNKNDEFGLVLGFKMYIKNILPNSLADIEGNIKPGDTILELQNVPIDNVSFSEAIKHVEKGKDKLKLIINKKIKSIVQDKNVKRPKYQNTRKSSLPSQAVVSNHPSTEFNHNNHIGDNSPRLISLDGDGGRCLNVIGGNKAGIFIGRLDSTHQHEGLVEGDLIIKVNDTEMFGKTKEEAVLLLLSTNEKMTLLVQHRRRDYERLLSESSTSSGDLFYVRSNFSYESSDPSELTLRRGDIFQVVDSISSGVIGSWRAVKVTGSEVKGDERRKGIIPNMNRAHQMTLSSLIISSKDSNQSLRKGGANLFKKRPKSGVGLAGFSPSILTDSNLLQQRPYDRVTLKHVPQRRPLVLCGVLSDAVSKNLIGSRPERFEMPEVSEEGEQTCVKYADIQGAAIKGKHALLSIDASSVDRLWKTDNPPIIIYLKADNKQVIKEVVQSWDRIHPNSSPYSNQSEMRKSPKKIFEQYQDFEKQYGHLFSYVMPLNTSDGWLKDLERKVNELQKEKVWINDILVSIPKDETFPISSNFNHFKPTTTTHKRSTNIYDDHVTGQERSTLSRSSSDPNLLKSTGSAIRYLPSYSTVSSLKSRKRSSKVHPIQVKGENGGGDNDRQQHHHHHERSASGGLDIEKRRTQSTTSYFGDNQSKGNQQTSPDVHHPQHASMSHQSYQPKFLTNHGDDIHHQHKQPVLQQQQQQHKQSIQQQQHKQSIQQLPHTKQLEQQNFGNHVRQFSYHPVFSSPLPSPTNQNGYQGSPEEMAPPYNPRTHPLHSRQQSDIQQHNNNNNNILYNGKYNDDNDHQKSFKKQNGHNPGILNKRHSRKSWNEEKLVKFGELSLVGHTEIPIEPDVYNRSIQNPHNPVHQRCHSSSSAPKSTHPIHPSIASPHPPLLVNSSSPQDGVVRKSKNYDDIRRGPFFGDEHGRKFGNNANNVIAHARGMFNSNGGILDSKETGVKIIIPKGALPPGLDQEVYFDVCKDTNNITPLDKARGEALLSPLVMCGPRGLNFLRPIELHIPHTATINPDTWSFSVKSTDSLDGDPKSWHQIHLENNNNNNNNNSNNNKGFVTRNQNTIAFLVERF